jgi:hypothetical protein
MRFELGPLSKPARVTPMAYYPNFTASRQHERRPPRSRKSVARTSRLAQRDDALRVAEREEAPFALGWLANYQAVAP